MVFYRTSDGRRWEPLRPLVIREQAYQGLEALSVRLLRLAVDACRRRASTLGELHRLLRYAHDLPLMDPNRPLIPEELTRYARPDIMIEQGRPRFLELNNGTRLGGKMRVPRLAEAYARLCPDSGLRPPPSTVTARSAALARTHQVNVERGSPSRVLIPTYRAIDRTGSLQHGRDQTGDSLIMADARRMGFEGVQADLADLRLDSTGRLLAAGVSIDVVLIEWGASERIVDAGDGLAALRSAHRAGAVQLFPHPEAILVSSKIVLAWLHEDCDAGVLTPVDRALVRTHVPWTGCLGLNPDPDADAKLLDVAVAERDRLVVKPAVKSGNYMLFGRQIPQRDWLPTIVHAAAESPLILQHRVESTRLAMPFYDRASRQQVIAHVPYVLSPLIIDNVAASVGLRHTAPGVCGQDVAIYARGRWNTVLLAPNGPPELDHDTAEPAGL